MNPGKASALEMLAAGPPTREAIREYEDACVLAARKRGATWTEIGDALDMARQNVQRRFAHLDDARGTDRRSERTKGNA